ncbi:MAG TPA: double-strand break repair protein AddB [Aliiroseovarius sp.]|nr:double-strand break repair protein AddB [Aliiroseovarius sp.]
MFEASSMPRVFSFPLGVDPSRALIRGLEARLEGRPPHAWARVEIFFATRRMQRRFRDLLSDGPARLGPRLHSLEDLAQDMRFSDLPQPVPALRRRFELMQLVRRLLERQPDLAPGGSAFDLADSLAALMDEMQGEGVGPDALKLLDVGAHASHWARNLEFLEIVAPFFGAARGERPDTNARARMVVERLVQLWRGQPPDHPVIVAGSTGSRGATALFMEAVARLPQGAVILPGFDSDQPAAIWERLTDRSSGEMAGEDHPQYRFALLLERLGLGPGAVTAWAPGEKVQNPARNRLVSLALRPAPVTDQWLREGRRLDGDFLRRATDRLSLIEAPSPRAEAVALALRLRRAVEDGQRAALITPDRTLARQVTAALDRWGIVPDDSAGEPLPLSPPGRFLRHVAELFGERLTAARLLVLLKHPLAASGTGRGDHLRFARDLELELLRGGLPFPAGAEVTRWAARHRGDAPRQAWAGWMAEWLEQLNALAGGASLTLDRLVAHHVALAEKLAAGPGADQGDSGELWEKPAGRAARRIMDEMLHEAQAGGVLAPGEYAPVLRAVLERGEVHDPDRPHPGVMIWGTLEARVQGADLVLLAGLNDGTWPEMPPADPWLNRRMRADAGLLSPERRIGLSAHDFQQGVAAGEVVLSRAVRDAESETVPSRWLSRLTNLLNGLAGGDAALEAMRARGAEYLTLAARLDERRGEELAPAPRPSPRPPVAHRPRHLSVTRISLLVRDPYAIYAERILKLRPLEPLHQTPDAPLRGTVLHKIAEAFIGDAAAADAEDARARMLRVAGEILDREVPWPAARILWLARLERVAGQFLADEAMRQSEGRVLDVEVKGRLELEREGFTLTATADRIDRLTDGGVAVYDYKSGTLPTPTAQKLYDKQLMLEAAIAQAGGFDGIGAAPVGRVAYIALGKAEPFRPYAPDAEEIAETRAGLARLIAAYGRRAQGYTALRLDPKIGFPSDYRHLARFGEWDMSQMPVPEEVGE